MKSNSFYLFLALLAIGCSRTEKNYVARVKQQKLTEAGIFDKELVYDVIFDSRESQYDSMRNQSRQLFLKGIDLYKNKKDPNGAVGLFRQSILLYPDAKTYYEMGSALLDAKSSTTALKEASGAFEVAQYLDFKPSTMVYYKMAAVKSLLRKEDNSGAYSIVSDLESAFDNGFSDTAMLRKDPAFHEIFSTKEYKEMIARWNAKKLDADPESVFELYKHSYQKYDQPYEIGFSDLADFNNKQSISYDFARFIPEMQNTSFGREVSHDFFYVAKVAETPVFSAVIYSSISFWEAEMQPVITKLVTYDNEGKIIASRIFAGQFSAEKIKTGRIENNELTLKDYKRHWKFPIDKVSFEENEVEKYELISTATFKITDEGEIKELSVPANYSDSVVFAKK